VAQFSQKETRPGRDKERGGDYWSAQEKKRDGNAVGVIGHDLRKKPGNRVSGP